jgi:hypothetical protein
MIAVKPPKYDMSLAYKRLKKEFDELLEECQTVFLKPDNSRAIVEDIDVEYVFTLFGRVKVKRKMVDYFKKQLKYIESSNADAIFYKRRELKVEHLMSNFCFCK